MILKHNVGHLKINLKKKKKALEIFTFKKSIFGFRFVLDL